MSVISILLVRRNYLMVKNLFKRFTALVACVVFVFTLSATSVVNFANASANTAYAASSCDKVNIVYCGVDGSSASAYISSFKSLYNSNKSGHAKSPTVKKDYTDLQAVYNWAGASKSIVSGMSTSNTKVGTLYKDGHITVDGATVATGASVTARFSNGSGFTKVEGNVYARKTTTSFAENSAQVIVYMNNGTFGFAVMTGCGNAVKGTPKETPKPPVVKSLTCDSLIFNSASSTDKKAFTFSAAATAKNTTITDYVFNFGDSQSKTVTSSAASVKTDHTYATAGNYTATVTVNSKDKKNVTSSNCSVKLSIAAPQAVLTCDQLTFTNKDNDYTFTANASAENTTITGYTFDFGDKTAVKNVDTSAKTATASHSYTTPGTYTAYVTVSSKDKKNVTSAKCAVQIKIPQPMCTVPGKETLPADSPECVETPVVTCDDLIISPNGDNKLAQSFVVKATAQHATITSYSVDFGDKSTVYTGANAAVNHTYAKAGNYTVKASVTATANGKTITKTSDECAGQVTIEQPMCTVPGKENLPADSADCKETPVPPVTPPTTPPTTPPVTPPTTLPNTGAGNVIGLFAGIAIAGAAAHRLLAGRRLFGSAE
jgi:PKD repeat protein